MDFDSVTTVFDFVDVLTFATYTFDTMATKQATRPNQAIRLKGSTALVTEFFEYSVNSCVGVGRSLIAGSCTSVVCIPLMTSGWYRQGQADDSMVKKYGLPMLVTSDEGLKEYIQTIMSQVSSKSIW